MSDDTWLDAAARAAAAFDIEVNDVEVMSRSENVVCALEAVGGERFAVRLHRPGYNTLAELESEVRFVRSLDDFGVPVPTARATTTGAHYVPIDVDGDQRYAGIVEWVPGEPLGGPLDGGATGLVDHYRTIGSLAARIRAHNMTWEPGVDFERRRWDAAGFVGDAPLWGRFWEVDALSPARRSLFAQARELLGHRLGSLSTGPDQFGMIHADLHLGNLMADGEALTVIDFDDAGFGWFMHELAVALHPVLGEPVFDDARAAIIEGYRSEQPLDEADVEQIDTFLAVRSLMIVAWLDARPELPVHEHFAEFVAEIEPQIEAFVAAG